MRNSNQKDRKGKVITDFDGGKGNKNPKKSNKKKKKKEELKQGSERAHW